jgi:Short-chain dehydrogenases of various substrate specificities
MYGESHRDDVTVEHDTTDRRTVLVVGAGPGLGSAVARRFADEGDRVGLLARSRDRLETLAATLREETPGEAVAAPADVTDPEAVERAFDTVRSAFGGIDVMVDTLYSTETASGGVLDVDVDAFEGAWAVETVGAFRCAKAAARDMLDRTEDDNRTETGARDGGGGGTILFTNSRASKRASAKGLATASARHGLRGMAASMARDLAPTVHVVHVVVDGWLDTPELREAYPDHPEAAWMDPESVADTYHHLVGQPADTRSFEVDLRSSRDPLLAPWDG